MASIFSLLEASSPASCCVLNSFNPWFEGGLDARSAFLKNELEQLEDNGFELSLLGWGDDIPTFADEPDYGSLEDFAIDDNGANASLGISATNHFGNFEKVNGRTTSDSSQQRHFLNDKGLEFSALTLRDIKWGKA